MLHIVKLIERRFSPEKAPRRRPALVASLLTLSATGMVLGSLLLLR
ncbi:hypothetical protein [Lysobacter silvisoli]|nr:hypothetical protein [Lysobacter silvisoli]